MKRTTLQLLLITALFFSFPGVGETNDNEIAVIVNKKNMVNSLSISEIKNIYENNRLKWDNKLPIVMYDLFIDNPVREFFSQIILGKSSRKIAEKWAHLKIANQAKNPPINVKSHLYVIKKIALNKGAIGYVPLRVLKERNNTSVKIVAILNK